MERGNWNAYGRALGRDNILGAIVSTAQRWESENSDSHSAEGFFSVPEFPDLGAGWIRKGPGTRSAERDDTDKEVCTAGDEGDSAGWIEPLAAVNVLVRSLSLVILETGLHRFSWESCRVYSRI